VAREKMWQKYYEMRTSEHFKGAWSDILKNINSVPCPIFYQFVTDKIMESLIDEYYRLQSESQCTPATRPLDHEDMCALRYTAGYVIHSLKKRAKAQPVKKEILLCLEELTDDHGSYTYVLSSGAIIYFSVGMHFSESWVDLLDRGGLVHVSDTTFMLSVCMEKELRLNGVNASTGIKEIALGNIAKNEDVLYHWSVLSANWREEEVNQELFKMIINHWVTIRGFSFTSAFMETYKQRKKKTVQKSKGLRKTLIGQGTRVSVTDEGDVSNENSGLAMAMTS
jgi:hypothetical protein